MTTPPEGPPAEPPAAEPAHEPAAETPSPPKVSPQPAPVGYPPLTYSHPAFAPVMRPHEPWINPAKRLPVAVIAVVIALVLLFGGLVVGFAVGDHRGERGYYGRFEPGFGPMRGLGAHPRYYPKVQPPAQQVPAPSPSKTG